MMVTLADVSSQIFSPNPNQALVALNSVLVVVATVLFKLWGSSLRAEVTDMKNATISTNVALTKYAETLARVDERTQLMSRHGRESNRRRSFYKENRRRYRKRTR